MAVLKDCHQTSPKVLLKWWLSLKIVIKHRPKFYWSDGCVKRLSAKTAQSSTEVMAVLKDCQQRLPKVLLKLCMWKLWMCLCVCLCVSVCVCVCQCQCVCVCIFLKEVKPVRFVVTFHMIFMIVFHSIVIRFFIGRAVEPDYSSCVCVFVRLCVCQHKMAVCKMLKCSTAFGVHQSFLCMWRLALQGTTLGLSSAEFNCPDFQIRWINLLLFFCCIFCSFCCYLVCPSGFLCIWRWSL